MQPAAVLFDLDDTLLPDDAATAAALLATCARAWEQYHLDPEALCQALRRHARALWTAAPTIAYCRAIGISSTEGLRASFADTDPRLQTLRDWAPTYRRQSWLGALAECGVDDALAERLAAAFPAERARRNVPFPETPAVLERLQRTHRLGLVTNGSPDLQRAKLKQSGLGGYFAVVIVSGEVGLGKPEAGIERKALRRQGGNGGQSPRWGVERYARGQGPLVSANSGGLAGGFWVVAGGALGEIGGDGGFFASARGTLGEIGSVRASVGGDLGSAGGDDPRTRPVPQVQWRRHSSTRSPRARRVRAAADRSPVRGRTGGLPRSSASPRRREAAVQLFHRPAIFVQVSRGAWGERQRCGQ